MLKEGNQAGHFGLLSCSAFMASLRWGRSTQRWLFLYIGAACLVLWVLWLNGLHEKASIRLEAWRSPKTEQMHADAQSDVNVHILILATQADVNLCKALMGSTILGYNSPMILGWNEQLDENLPHGGSHALKITKSFEYLASIDKKQDDDIVLIIDAYDLQFQLPPEVLVERFTRVMAESNQRLKAELGNAYEAENIRNSIFFGAAKRHWPNPFEEISAWTVPESPAPHDIYGNRTDTAEGYTEYYSRRQRFLNAGFLVGKLGPTRDMYARASQRLDVVASYNDSDQSLMSIMMGEQSHWRERMRIQHVSWWRQLLGASKPRDNWVDGIHIDNILDPSMDHIPFTPDPNVKYEYGISLDYLIDFSHQTSGSEISRDSTWIRYGNAVEELKLLPRSYYDCKVRASTHLPDDIARLPSPYIVLETSSTAAGETPGPNTAFLVARKWSTIPLYTHLCYGSIPVFVHHNGEKLHREWSWTNMWYQSAAKKLLTARMREDAGKLNGTDVDLEEFKKKPFIVEAGGAWSGQGSWLSWPEICPAEQYGRELYRSSDPADWL